MLTAALAWLRDVAWAPLLVVLAALALLWRSAAADRDEARRDLAAETARADAAAASAERERQVLDDALAAQAERDAAERALVGRRAAE